MKRLGILISLCIHTAYSAVSGLMLLGFLESLENGSFAESVPEGSGMIGLIILALLGGLLIGLLLLFLVSLAAVLFEVCDLLFDKRGFAFAYGLISFGFLLFIGSGAISTGMELFHSGGLTALWSVEMAALLCLVLTALVPTAVAAVRIVKK